MTHNEYWAEIADIAQTIASEALSDNDGDIDAARDDIFDLRLHETIDGHQWVIYYAYHLDVLKHTDNAEYMVDNFGGESVENAVKDGGVDGLHTAMAFWAMYADVSERIEGALEELTEESEAA